jgi:hypothetical protein
MARGGKTSKKTETKKSKKDHKGEIIMKIAKTLTVLAVVALLLNGCAGKENIVGDKTGSEAIPSPSPTPKVK